MKTSSRGNHGDVNREHTTRIAARRWLTEDSFLLDLEWPEKFHCSAGQHLQITIDGESREYSIIIDAARNFLTLLIRRVSGGAVTRLLAACKVGTSISFTGPDGYFTYRPSDRTAVFVATGTGIAPFVSMCREGVTGMILLHGVRHPEELYFKEQLKEAALLYQPCISGEIAGIDPKEQKEFSEGRVTGYLQSKLPPGDYDFYLSGRGEMITDATAIIDQHFPASRVFSEVFF